MLKAVTAVVDYMDRKGLSDDERLRLLGSVARLNADAVAVKKTFEDAGLTEEEQGQAIRAIRTLIKPRKSKATAKAAKAAKKD